MSYQFILVGLESLLLRDPDGQPRGTSLSVGGRRAKLAIIRGIMEFVVVDIISSSDPAIAKLNNSLAGFQYELPNYFIGTDPG